MVVPEKEYRVSILNLLISAAVSLVVNFSSLLFILMERQEFRLLYPSGERHIVQFIWFTLIAFILITMVTLWTSDIRRHATRFAANVVICSLLTVAAYMLTPTSQWEGNMTIMALTPRWFNPMLILKCSFTFIVAILYGKIFELIFTKQQIEIENQLLKNENLQTTYDMLIGQINPHFLFNSLNSLSMLVREKHNNDALTYIERLSETFRYIIGNEQRGLTTLREELKFLNAYTYLLEVRYANKLFVNISIPEELKAWELPSMTLQPLVENAVGHNTTTTKAPLTIEITAREGKLTVTNPIRPKIEATSGTGIGLKNLAARYRLLAGREISVTKENNEFNVTLPLIEPVQ
jgi:hypothetical protein